MLFFAFPHARQTDFRRGKKLGIGDHQVVWHQPKQCPKHMSESEASGSTLHPNGALSSVYGSLAGAFGTRLLSLSPRYSMPNAIVLGN